MPVLFAVAMVWLVGVASLAVAYRGELHRLWREPVFRRPVLVLESDDWGAGPLSQAAALDDIAQVLARHRDAAGRPAVMNLAVVLAVPDGPAMAAHGQAYRRIDLDQAAQAPNLAALRRGESAGVFALQLHGLEHYWPPSVMASVSPAVQDWLRGGACEATEQLPAALQSRWVDARALPSRPLDRAAVEQAVAEEVAVYTRVLGQPPRLVVPPTFVWTPAVEDAWLRHGLQGVVTPGRRYTARDAAGDSVADGVRFANGDRRGGLVYLVRSDYFEPLKGRDAAHALRALERALEEGRACLLENHRINFCRDPRACQDSLVELDKLIGGALRLQPRLQFLSTLELRTVLAESDSDTDWLVRPWRQRLPFFWRRLQGTGRLWKLLRWSGAAFFGGRLVRLLQRRGELAHG